MKLMMLLILYNPFVNIQPLDISVEYVGWQFIF